MTFYRFQNSLYGIVMLEQDFNKGKLFFKYAKATNPKKPNEIKKGDKIYDYQNQRIFAIDIKEAKMIQRYIRIVLQKSFDVGEFELTHFPKNKVHIIKFEPNKAHNKLTMSFALIENKKVVYTTRLNLDVNDLYVLLSFLESYDHVITLSNYDSYKRYMDNRNNNTQQNNNNTNRRQTNNTQHETVKHVEETTDTTSFFDENEIF